MNENVEQVEGEVVDTLPTAQRENTALAQTENPYLRMAEMAMTTGKVDQLDKLLDLQIKWDAEQARRAYTAAMSAFKAEPIKIVKAKKVEFTTRDGDVTSYRHATLASVVDAVVAGMGKHGLSHRWDVKQQDGKVEVTCTVTHSGGHSESVSMSSAPDSSGKKNSIQQVASAVTYLQRYTLMAITGVAAEDMEEDDGVSAGAAPDVEYITDEQVTILRDLIESYVANAGKFMDWVSAQAGYKVNELADIPADCYERIHMQLGSIRNQRLAKERED